MAAPELIELTCKDAAAWEAWLLKNGDDSPGVWLHIGKKNSGFETVSYYDAVGVALCFGWIDSQKTRGDDLYFRQRFTPRRAKSIWSQINVERIEALTNEGRMQPAGIKQVEAAQADGRWDAAYPPASRAEVPDDLAQALAANPAAHAFFATLSGANRFAILFRIGAVKRADTRARRIAEFVAMLERGETVF